LWITYVCMWTHIRYGIYDAILYIVWFQYLYKNIGRKIFDNLHDSVCLLEEYYCPYLLFSHSYLHHACTTTLICTSVGPLQYTMLYTMWQAIYTQATFQFPNIKQFAPMTPTFIVFEHDVFQLISLYEISLIASLWTEVLVVGVIFCILQMQGLIMYIFFIPFKLMVNGQYR